MADLKNLIKYYLDCLSKDFEKGFGEFARDNLGYGLKYGQLGQLPFTGNGNNIYGTDDVRRVINRVVRDNKLTLYLGYPVYLNIFTAKNGNQYHRIEPLFLFKYDRTTVVTGGNPVLENVVPVLNPDPIAKISGMTRNALRDEIFSIYEAINYDDYSPHTDLINIISNLHNARQYWNWIDIPDIQNINVSSLSGFDVMGIYNCAALFAVPKSKYTEGLDAELRELLKLIDLHGDESFEGSALYDWFKNKVPEAAIKDKPLLEPLPLNEEQKLAVKQSLQLPLTIIEGPPGTGKSQVVTSIILNSLLEEKSVFFSSKTNNAVSVVLERTNGITPYEILVKLGGESQYTRLLNFFNNVLNRQVNDQDRRNFQITKANLDKLLKDFSILIEKEQQMVANRNYCDEQEQKVEEYRVKYSAGVFKDIMGRQLNYFTDIRKKIAQLKRNFDVINKARFSFSDKLSWLFTKSKKLNSALGSYMELLRLSEFVYCDLSSFSEKDIEYAAIIEETTKLENQLTELEEIHRYFTFLNDLSGYSFGDSAKKLNEIEYNLTQISITYIQLWLKMMYDGLSQLDQNNIRDFVTTLALISPDSNNIATEVWRRYYSLFESVKKYIPSMTVTSLSVNKRIPLQKGFFDILVVDEASACDIASVIPLLYRAKNVVIIGDKNQLNHITNMNSAEDTRLLSLNGLVENHMRWSYTVNSVLDLSLTLNNSSKVNLLNHHRSHPQIINFCNKNFYNENLRILTKTNTLKYDTNNQIIRWVDCVGAAVRPVTGGAFNIVECNAVINELRRLMNNNYNGSIGVVTPFTLQVVKIEDEVTNDNQLNAWLNTKDFICDTAHGFQGDERDLIIFSTVISNNPDSRTLGFLKSTGNLFNVAISRARASLIIVGNKNACFNSGVNYLTNFVNYYDNLHSLAVNATSRRTVPIFQSEWEDSFDKMLRSNNIHAVRQKNVDIYTLDFAIELENGKKLDIEIDGEYYHRNWNNELAIRDRLRNRRLIEMGWDIHRFWVYQVRDDSQRCIDKIKNWIKNNQQH